MIEKWGYKLPFCPCDRAFRACYRATVHHCLLQDISYYNCVEISGDFEVLINGFKKITDSNVGLSIGARSYITGAREGGVTLFRADDSKVAIGIVNFIWRPSKVDGKHSLWLWLHASFYKEAFDTIISCFSLKLSSECVYYASNNNVRLIEQNYELNRFRLTGPLANLIIQNAFKVADFENMPEDCWIKSFYGNSDDEFSHIIENWKRLQYMCSPHVVLPFIIQDPRFNLPKKRTKASLLSMDTVLDDSELTVTSFDSPLWNSDIRKTVAENKISQAKLAELRSNLLVPGSDLEEKPATIPIILIQRPGKVTAEYTGYGSGWDIIFPSAWAQPLWISLVMWGCRTGGLRETDSIDFESDQQYVLYPDTESGRSEENVTAFKSREKFFRLPPNKRTNYNKLGITSPLSWNWGLVMNEWSKSAESTSKYFVLRDRKVLRALQKILKVNTRSVTVPEIPNNFLIPVSVKLLKKGCCKQFAIICFPQDRDVKVEPVEPNHEDTNEELRKHLRKEHKILLKRLRRRRIRAKRIGKIIPIDFDILRSYTQRMRQLWLPEAKTIRHSCSREVMGFIKHGDFSLLSGRSKAIGYITAGALQKLLLQANKNRVLVRNTNSRQYRLGILEVICE